MVDRLRLLLHRPLRDADRPRLFAVAVALIVAAAGALAVLDDATPSASHAPATSAAPRPPTVASEPSVAPSAPPPTVPSEEGTAPANALASPAEVRRAKRVARRFLVGYLAYTYGRRSARAIAGADRRLRKRLAHDRPRVPPRERQRRPRVVLVQSDAAGRLRARLVALVRDGRRRYTVTLVLARARAGWRVTAVGG